MANIQSNFKKNCQHQHFEVIIIIWSRVDHDSWRKLKIHQKSKVTKLGFSYGEVNWTLTKHNSHMPHQIFLNQSWFWRKFNSLQLCLSKLKSKKMLHLRDMDQNITGHFKSQQKDTFCQSNLHQVRGFKCKNYQHRGCKGHFEVSKTSKITFIR